MRNRLLSCRRTAGVGRSSDAVLRISMARLSFAALNEPRPRIMCWCAFIRIIRDEFLTHSLPPRLPPDRPLRV